MKAYVTQLLATILGFIILLVAVNLIGQKLINKKMTERNVVVDRINAEIEEIVNKKEKSDMISDSAIQNGVLSSSKVVEDVFTSRKSEWQSLYGDKACPEDVQIVFFYYYENEEEKQADKTANISGIKTLAATDMELGDDNSIIRGIYFLDMLVGVAEYKYSDIVFGKIIILMNVAIIISLLLVISYSIWMYRRIIVPFNRLSDYPERLSKGATTEKLPEKKDKFFGRYIWGMNMLADKLENDRKSIRRISDEHQKMVTVLVHGIKTPAANIKLLSEAIATGLYDPEGKINEKDAELAAKIEKNADEIEHIVTEAVDTANATIFEYDGEIKPFYRKEIEDFIHEEYSNRLKVNRIEFSVEAEGNPMVNSDFDGICRILRQLMDNAIKYGDGNGITLKMEKTDEGHFITIANKGETLPESELPFVFNSMWRGSNSRDVKGSGVGLYEARFIARKLGGDIKMRIQENETEVTLFLPLDA